jgi:hypothetical protein
VQINRHYESLVSAPLQAREAALAHPR